MSDPRLPNLFSPIKIKGLELRNRIVMAPMGVRYGTVNRKTTDRLRRFYAERARGGAGLITLQAASVAPEGAHVLYTPVIWSDAYIPDFAVLAADAHEAGAKIAVQLGHGGAGGSWGVTWTRPVSASPLAIRGGEAPRPLSLGEIDDLEDKFARAALRARQANCDVVEFHAGHGYLFHQFLSPLYNRRQDQYGGSNENRARFLLESIKRTRELVGDDFPISVRISGDEYNRWGLGIADACRLARWLEEAGVDILSISAGGGGTYHGMQCSLLPPGGLVPLAAAVRQGARVPVAAVGRLHRPELAESVLAEGKADLIVIGRQLLADPDWPIKAAEGRWDEIRPCLACPAPECSMRGRRQMDMTCAVNPRIGREDMFDVARVDRPKRVMVVGGGPAGMKAAVGAAERGHQVTLFERGQTLGGQLPLAATPPGKAEMGWYLEYLRGLVGRSGVQVVNGVVVDEELVRREQPEVVIVATGGSPSVPPVPTQNQQVATSWQVLSGEVLAGKKVVVVGGGDVGCETALFLVGQGKDVTILEMLPEVARELMPMNREVLFRLLEEGNVEILTNSKVVSLKSGTVTYDRGGVVYWVRGVDTVVFATGVKPEDSLGKRLAEKGFEVRLVGDCVKPGSLGPAVRAGLEAGIGVE